MAQPQRSSDIVESHSEHALASSLGGLVALALGFLLWIYRGDGWLSGLALVLMIGGLVAIGYGIYSALQIRKVQSATLNCPYCDFTNRFTEAPMGDVSCRGCNRMISIDEGRVLKVMQVRCGYCNELNYYTEKNVALICESCNHEIPIAQADGNMPTKKLLFASKEDDALYELVLISHGAHHTENLIAALQQMLALNRNQVKDMLMNLPVTLLTGIPRKKAEMLQAQLSIHEAAAEFRPVAGG
ncbi:MAG: hypothetical protein WAO58_06225 [Fimbriimonadaceae bacterium]